METTLLPIEADLEDVVLFDLPRDGQSLCRRLEGDRLAWQLYHEGRLYVAATIHPREGDLADLLRTVQVWADELSVPRIHFVVDGRSYTLRLPVRLPVAA
jgi:hypothetical protein